MTKSCGPIGLLRYLSSADDAHDPDSDKLSEISLLLFALSGRRSFSLFQYIHSQSKKGKIRNKIKDRVISYFQKGNFISQDSRDLVQQQHKKYKNNTNCRVII